MSVVCSRPSNCPVQLSPEIALLCPVPFAFYLPCLSGLASSGALRALSGWSGCRGSILRCCSLPVVPLTCLPFPHASAFSFPGVRLFNTGRLPAQRTFPYWRCRYDCLPLNWSSKEPLPAAPRPRSRCLTCVKKQTNTSAAVVSRAGCCHV